MLPFNRPNSLADDESFEDFLNNFERVARSRKPKSAAVSLWSPLDIEFDEDGDDEEFDISEIDPELLDEV